MSLESTIKNANSKDSTLGKIGAFTGFNPIAAGNIAGNLLGLDNNDQIDEAIGSLDEIRKMASQVGAENRSLYGDYWDKMTELYGEGAGKYSDAFQKYLDAVEANAGKQFEYSKDVSDFYSPAAEQRKQAAMDAIAKSSANAGGMFSSDYLNALAAKQQALASEEYDKAYSRMQQDRGTSLAEWQANANQAQQDLANSGNVVSLYGKDRDSLSSAFGDYVSQMASQNNADLSATSDIVSKIADLNTKRKSGNAEVLGLAGKVFGGLFGA